MDDDSSSDGSDHVERCKNVARLLVKSNETQCDIDENCAYKQKLGDLIFDADFEGGNLGGVKQINSHEYDLSIRPDVSNSMHSVWFNFKVSNQRPNQSVIFNFTNLSERLPLFSEVGLSPVARSQLHPNWVRLKVDQVFYYKATDRGNRHQLSIAFRFSLHDDEHQFALFYPYTLTTLENFIARWTVHLKRLELTLDHVSAGSQRNTGTVKIDKEHRTGVGSRSGARITSQASTSLKKVPILDVRILTKSALSKPIYELSVQSKAIDFDKRSNVIVIGRPIGNLDSACSIVCQGLMDFMLCDDPVAMAARDHINLLIFPMLDPDSIWVGNTKTDLMGQRSIDSDIVNSNPSLYANYRLAIEKINGICESSQSPTVILDLRVNPNLIGARFVGTLYGDSLRMERHLRLPRLMSRFSDVFYLEKCKFIEEKQTSENLFLIPNKSKTENYRFEISPFGYHKRSLTDNIFEQFDQMKYLLLGKSIVFALIARLERKDKKIPRFVRDQLRMFQKTPQDIDDLVLFQS